VTLEVYLKVICNLSAKEWTRGRRGRLRGGCETNACASSRAGENERGGRGVVKKELLEGQKQLDQGLLKEDRRLKKGKTPEVL